MPAPRKQAVADKKESFGFYQNKEGRVFTGTREIAKQARTNKFGLVRISKSIYDEAMKSKSGMTDPVEEVELDGDTE
jgi:ribosomal protein L7Ae-like RNA K-turn-binding protein